MINVLARFFSLTKYEARGMILIFLICVLVVGTKHITNIHTPSVEIRWVEDQKNSNKNISQSTVYSTKEISQKDSEAVQKKDKVGLRFPKESLNLNTTTITELEAIGYQDYKINSLINFRKSIGHYHNPKQLYQLYGWDKVDIDTLLKHAQIVLPVLHLNKMSSKEFEQLYGIGEVLAQRIIDYRLRLGGFHSTTQLLEVYGIKEDWLNELSKKYRFQVGTFKTLNFNTIQLNELGKHPYINDDQAKEIILSRSMGNLKDTLELKRILEKQWHKIAPYVEL